MAITHQFVSVLIMASVTFALRFLPLAMFKGRIKSQFICSFLQYVPFAVLGAMIFPSVLTSTKSFYSAVAGVLVTISISYIGKSLIEIIVISVIVVYIIEQFLL